MTAQRKRTTGIVTALETGQDEIDPQQVKAALRELLDDPAFRRAPRIATLLDYLVNQAIGPDRDRVLGGYQVGIEALNKPADFDPSTNAGVRVETARLRRMLDNYYAEHASPACSISLPKGTYRPVFSFADATDKRDAIRPSGGPAIAVLGFVDGQTGNVPLAIALREELIDELYRYREFHVVDASGVALDDPALAQTRCRDLECEYMLTASISSGDTTHQVSLSVVDLSGNQIAWRYHNTFEAGRDNLFDFSATVAADLARQLVPPGGQLPLAEIKKRLGRNIESSTASDCITLWHVYRLRQREAETWDRLWRNCSELVERDPFFALGLTMQSMLLVDRVVYHRTAEDDTKTLSEARLLAHQAVSIDPDYAYAHYMLAQCHYFQGDLDAFLAAIDQALALHPRNIDLLHNSGSFLFLSGHKSRAKRLLSRAGLAYHNAVGYRFAHILVAYDAGHHETARALLETSLVPEGFHAGKIMAALIYAALGDYARARKHLVRDGGTGSGTLYTLHDVTTMASLWVKDPSLHAKVTRSLNKLLDNDDGGV